MNLLKTALTISALILLTACETTQVAAPAAPASPTGAAALEGAVIGSDGLVP